METSLDLSRWREKPRGVGYRRWTIVSAGLRELLGTRLFRVLLFLSWSAGILIAVCAFMFSQSVASGGWLESITAHIGARSQALVAALGGLIVLYPDVCIGGFYT